MSETLAHMKSWHWKLVKEDYEALRPGVSPDIFEGKNALTIVYNHYLAKPRSEPIRIDNNKRPREKSESKKRAKPRTDSAATTQVGTRPGITAVQNERPGSLAGPTSPTQAPIAPTTSSQLPPIKPAEFYTSPIINVFTYDPTDTTDDVPGEGEDIPGVSKPFRLYRAALERASEYFRRYFKAQDERAAEASSTNTRTVRIKREIKTESGIEKTEKARKTDTIHLSKRHIPSAAAFGAFIEFAYGSGTDYSCPFEDLDAKAIFHAEVYVMAHSLQSRLLQRIAVSNIHNTLMLVSTGKCEAMARMCELLYNMPGSPDGLYPNTMHPSLSNLAIGVEASYLVMAHLEGTARDPAQLMSGFYLVTHKDRLKSVDGDNLKAIEEVIRKTPQLAVDIFHLSLSGKGGPELFAKAQPKFA